MNDDEFGQVTAQQFGQMETAVGADMYQAQVATQQGYRLVAESRALIQTQMAKMIGAATLLMVLAMLPVLVWLWKWAL